MNTCLRWFALLSATTVSLTLASCAGARHTASEVVEKTLPAAAKPKVFVQTFNGTIDVVADEGLEIKAKVTKRGAGPTPEAAQADLKNIEVRAEKTGENTFQISARRTDSKGGNSGASAEVRVPKEAELELRTDNGKVLVRGPVAGVHAHTGNGAVEVTEANGAVRVETSNGAVKLTNITGKVSVEGSNGTIIIKDAAGPISARSDNGNVTYAGTLAEGESSLRTDNGRIHVTLPKGSQFHVDAETSNGSVTNAFPVVAQETTAKTSLRGTIGDQPRSKLHLRTSNGNIEINQRE